MNDKKPGSRYFIPAPYYEPSLFALKLFHDTDCHLGEAINIAYASFSNGKLPPQEFNKKKLRSYILDWLRADSDYRRYKV